MKTLKEMKITESAMANEISSILESGYQPIVKSNVAMTTTYMLMAKAVRRRKCQLKMKI
jgi:hypothetical protein